MLGVRDVSAVCDQSIFSHGEYPLNILEPRKTPKRSYAISRLQDNPDAYDHAGHSGTERLIPKLSAARTMPSLYFRPRTLVPTILGFCVCCTGDAVCVGCDEGWKEGLTGCIGSTLGKKGDDIVDLGG